MHKKKRQIKWWMLYGLLLVFWLILLILPLIGAIFATIITAFVSVPLIIILKRKDKLAKFRFTTDLMLIILLTAIFFAIVVALGIFAFASVAWWKIIVIGLVADAIVYGIGFVPVVGDVLSAVIVGILIFVLAMWIGGGLAGIILGVIAMFLALIPNIVYLNLPIPIITIAFIIFNLISEYLAGFLSGLLG